MKFKLSLSLFFIMLLMLISGLCVSANLIENIDVISEELKNADELTYVTKGDLAYTISKILGSGELKSKSDYINFANNHGYLLSDEKNAEDIIDLHMFNEACVRMIGHEPIARSYGGGDNGNFKAVFDAKIYKGVDISTYDKVSVSQFKQLIYNLLTVETSEYGYSYSSGGDECRYSGEKKNILTAVMKLSAYKCVIKNTSNDGCSVEILDNIYKHNSVILPIGTKRNFNPGGCVDLHKFEYAPVEIWVDENDKIVYIQPLKNVEIFYDVIYSVNNDDGENKYAIDYISKIEFLRDKKSHNVSSECVFVYNEKETIKPTVFVNKFAKIIKVDNEITFIETWDLQDGGLITGVTNDSITYQKGQYKAKLTEISSYDKLVVIIDAISTDRTQIKANSVFSCYKNKNTDTLVIVVSEKMVAGTFETIGDGEIGIDGINYNRDSNIYFSDDGKTYRKNEYRGMFDNLVAVYIDYSDKVKYVKVLETNTSKTNTVLAYTMGIKNGAFDEIIVYLYTVEPGIQKIECKLHEKVQYEDGLSASSLIPITKTNAHEAILKFEINEKNEIKKVSLPEYWYIYGKTDTLQETATNFSFPLFENTAEPTVYIAVNPSTNPTGGAHLKTYLYDAQYVVICEEGGQLVPKQATWSELLCKTSTDVKMTLYAKEDESTPRLAVIYGNTENIAHYTKVENAIITQLNLAYDEESDEFCYNAVFLETSGERKVKLSKEFGDTLSENMFITYKPEANFNANGIIVTNKMPLPSDFTQWSEMDNMEGGMIEKVDKYRLFLQGGRAYQMESDCVVFGVQVTERGPRFISMSLDEIQHGDYCVYNNSDRIQILFVEITEK